MTLPELTGLEHLSAIITGEIAPPSIFDTMGMYNLEATAGTVTIGYRAQNNTATQWEVYTVALPLLCLIPLQAVQYIAYLKLG
jgi:hypothetical protein